MTVYDTIQAAITKGRLLAIEHGLEFIATSQNGGQSGCCELKMCVLVQWVCILEGFICQNYDSTGVPRVADYECLTQDQALELVSKINKLACP